MDFTISDAQQLVRKYRTRRPSLEVFYKKCCVYKWQKKKKEKKEKIVLVKNKKLTIPEQVTPANP